MRDMLLDFVLDFLITSFATLEAFSETFFDGVQMELDVSVLLTIINLLRCIR